MKQFLLFVFLASVILESGCRKESNSPGTSPQVSTVVDCALDTFRFDRVLQSTDEYIDMIQDRGKRIVAITQNRIERYDINGTLEWSKPLAQTGTMQNVIQADNDNYFVAAASRRINDYTEGEFYAQGIPNGSEFRITNYWRDMGYINTNCSKVYQLITKSINDSPDVYVSRSAPPVNNSICTLFKLNHQGSLIWTKSFKGNTLSGKSLAVSPDGNWFLLTYQSSGFYQKATFDLNGVFQDTISIPLTENTVTLYKINSDGAVLWEKKITDINKYQDHPNASLAVTSNSVCIQTEKDYIVLDQKGNIIQRRRPGTYFCFGTGYSITAQSDLFYSIGDDYDPASTLSKTYLQVSNSNGDVLSHTFIESLSLYSKIDATVDGLLINDGLLVIKYSISGSKLWSIPGVWLPGSHNITCSTPSCSGGVIFFKKYPFGQIDLIKTDANGKY